MRILLFLIFIFVTVTSYGAVTVTVNGTNHTIPQTNERGWGPAVTAWIQAISQFSLQPTGGNFTLSADANFGPTYGLKANYFSTRSANPSGAGLFRLSNSDYLGWRNAANDGNLLLAVNGSNQLTFNGSVLATTGSGQFQDSTFNIFDDGDNTKKLAFEVSNIATGTTRTLILPDANVNLGALTNANISGSAAIDYSKLNLTGSIVNADVNASAAIAYSKLNLGSSIVNADISGSAAIARSKVASGTANHVIVNDGSGNLSSEANLAISRGGTGAGTKTAAYDSLSPSTTKGDITVYDGSDNVRLAVGSDGQVLISDSTAPNGIQWSSSVSGSGTGPGNVLLNGSFENTTVTDNWTVTSGTAAAETTMISPGGGVKALKMTLSAVNGTVVSQSQTPTAQFAGVNTDSGLWVKTSQANVQVCSLQAGSEVSCADAPYDNNWHYVFVTNFGPSSGSLGVRLKTKSSVTGDVYVDAGYVGVTQARAPVPGASLWGEKRLVSKANCSWPGTTTAAWTSYGTDGDCNADSVLGYATSGTTIPGITLSSLPAGDYQVVVSGIFSGSGSTNAACGWRVTDGTNTSGTSWFFFSASTAGIGTSPQVFSFHTSADQTNATIQVQYFVDGAGSPSCNMDASNATKHAPYGLVISVYKMPNAATTQQVFAANQLNVSGSVTWANTSGAFSEITSTATWTSFSDTDFATNRSNNGACQTDSSSELSCKVAYLPAGEYEVSYTGNLYSVVTTNGSGVTCNFGIYDGTTRINGTGYANPLTGLQNGIAFPGVTARFKYTAPQTNIIFKLQAYQESSTGKCGVGLSNGVQMGQLSLKPISVATPMPLITQSVIKSSTVYDQGVTGVTSIDSGTWTPTYTNNTNVAAFTSTPACQYTRIGAIVSGSCLVALTCSSGSGTATYFHATLPIASDLQSTEDLTGVITATDFTETGAVYADTSGNRLTASFRCAQGGSDFGRIFTFQYRVR